MIHLKSTKHQFICNTLAKRNTDHISLEWETDLDFLELLATNKILIPFLLNAPTNPAVSNDQQEKINIQDQKLNAYFSELEAIYELLDKHHIPTILLENGALAREGNADPRLFSFGDFDLLISIDHLEIVDKLMLNYNYRLHSMSEGRKEYKCTVDQWELRFNFQTELVARKFVAIGSTPSFTSLLARSKQLPASRVRILGPEDFLFQLCIHNASHAYIRKPGILLHLDIYWFLQYAEINWPLFLDNLQKHKCKTQAYIALAIPHALFGLPIPDPIYKKLQISALKESRISSLLNQSDLFEPDEQKFSNLNYLYLLLLLADDTSSLLGMFFPNRAWMEARHPIQSSWQLPFYHFKRFLVLFNRRLLG